MPRKKRVLVEPSESGEIPLSRIKEVVRGVHVVPEKKGGWTVMQGGKQKVEVHFPKKKDAVCYGEGIRQERGTSMFIHMKNGKVREVNGYDQASPYSTRD